MLRYLGHLLFGGAFPHARIFQLFVAPEFRGQGVGRHLLEALVKLFERHSFLSISARVADDLAANKFWDKMGFGLARRRPGGLTRSRVINVRIKQLDTPGLFNQLMGDVSELALVDRLAARQAVYLIDLNVFWDVVRQRPRAEYAAQVISAALRHLIYVVIADEFVAELERTSRSAPNDPVLEFALQLPVLGAPESSVLEALIDEVAPLVFPARTGARCLSQQERSDLIHLATAIHHGANGFVTGDSAILHARDDMHSRYGLELVGVQELSKALEIAQKRLPSFRAQLSSDTLYVLELVGENSSALESFLREVSAPSSFREDFLTAGAVPSSRKRIAVTSDTDVVCLASWDVSAGLQGRTDVRLVANEEHAAVQTALNCILSQVSAEASRIGPVLLRLDTPSGHVISREVALLHGFHAETDCRSGIGRHLQKVSIGRPVTGKNWVRIRRSLQQCSGLSFQDIPVLDDTDTQVAFSEADGAERTVRLSQLERLLSPVLIVLANRPGAIAPIRRGYAEQLLRASQQMSLTPNREAGPFSERVYFSSSKNVRILSGGTPLLFYESGGSGGRACVTAVARVLSTELRAKSEISGSFFVMGLSMPAR